MDIKKEYSNLFKYLLESKSYFYTCLIFFLIGALLDIFLFNYTNSFFEEIYNQLPEGSNLIFEFFNIFKNNIIVTFHDIFYGAFLFIYPVFSSIKSGFVMDHMIIFSGSSLLEFIYRFFPYGIIEFFVIIISSVLGIRLGFKNYLYFFNYNRGKIFKIILGIFSSVLGFFGAIVFFGAIFSFSIFMILVGLLLMLPFLLLFIYPKKLRVLFIHELIIVIKIYILLCIPLLLIATLIESFVIYYF